MTVMTLLILLILMVLLAIIVRVSVLRTVFAFATRESMSLRARIVFDNLRAWLDGAPINVIL